MSLQMFALHLLQAIDLWIKALDQYSLSQLQYEPQPQSWSLGQLYIHLIEDTQYYFEQIELCAIHNENSGKGPSPEGIKMLATNAFPDIRIEGAVANAFLPQPENKEVLIAALLQLKDRSKSLKAVVDNSSFKGKTKHPGLGYFSAADWLQFAAMHFQHHLKQKQRIEDALESNAIV